MKVEINEIILSRALGLYGQILITVQIESLSSLLYCGNRHSAFCPPSNSPQTTHCFEQTGRPHLCIDLNVYIMQLFILSLLVCIHTLLVQSNANKTYMLHLRWLPTHCLNRYCTVPKNITMDISKLTASPQFDWMNITCLKGHSFSALDFNQIPDLNTYWTDPFHDTFTHFLVYYKYGACTVMGESGPSPILYFNHGINLYKKLMTPKNVKKLHNILEKKVHWTAKVEGKLLKTFGVLPKLICAQSEAGSVYLHELVFCFNEASSLVNCPSEYPSHLDLFDPDVDVEDEDLLKGEIESQVLCPATFIIPDYKILGDAKDEKYSAKFNPNGIDEDDDDYVISYYDEDGDNEDGHDEDGHDEDGHDKDGHDEDGEDEYGHDEDDNEDNHYYK
ncbi:unnamed protein product [Trichobilharzia szidati]|nr:unnamed protein product [Trichobilharzia szidati]